MKRNIIFYRHAKSDWSMEYPDDHERPLAERGIVCAGLMGRILAFSGQTPDLVISSSAARARQTAEISIESGGWESPLKIMSILYAGNAAAIMKLLNNLEDKYRCVLLVGHEPSWSGLASFLIDGGNLRFPTGAMARIEFKIKSWRDLKPGLGELRWLLQPGFFQKGSFNL
ncbi:MAG: histidine phosphatase family protein [FCB group bacterium]|nr:histidine phosphatase family protein [FCB group bacterium]